MLWVLVVVLVAVGVAGAGFLGGATWTHHRTELGGWHTGVAHAGTKRVSIEYDGWTYGASESVDSWVDRNGSWHEAGWPDCLRVPPGSQIKVRFQSRAVTVDDITWRPIVAVDCGAAG